MLSERNTGKLWKGLDGITIDVELRSTEYLQAFIAGYEYRSRVRRLLTTLGLPEPTAIAAYRAELEQRKSHGDPNAENYRVFERERDELLTTCRGQYAAYHEGNRLYTGPDRNIVYAEARRQVPHGLIMVQPIVPKDEEPVFRISSRVRL